MTPKRAIDDYERALSRSWKRGATWAALAAAAATYLAFIAIVVFWSPLRSIHGFWVALAQGASYGLITWVLIALFETLRTRALRRCIRAELGTHCTACDYDLRGTPDVTQTAAPRCPECGKPIPRNVHRAYIEPAPGTKSPT